MDSGDGESRTTDAPGGARRIVSLMPSCTETLVALGAGDRLVGIGDFDPAVPDRPELPRLGDARSVNLESLVALTPDTVLVNHRAVAARLEALPVGIRVLTVPTDNLAQIRTSVASLARLVDKRPEGERILAGIDEAVAAARERAENRPGPSPRVLLVVQHSPWFVAGGGSYLHELLRIVGARNVAGDLDDAWPTLGAESIVTRAPDVILDSSMGMDGGPDKVELRAAWNRFPSVPAVRGGRIVAVVGDVLFRPGPRIPDAIAELERLLFGGDEK